MPDEEKKEEVTTEVEKKESTDEVDWEALYKEKDNELHRVAAERENYKKVALSKKGKSDEGESEETDDERIKRIVAEQMAESNYARVAREKEEIAERALKENKELKVALKSRDQVGIRTAGGGQDQDSEITKDSFWTEEQLEYFRKRGLDPNKVRENYQRIKEK